MKPISVVICTLVTLFMVLEIESMGICFGGYPACCANGKNTCGPFCASCSRVDEFLHNMMMFMMHGMGTPAVFRIINKDPFVQGPKRPVPFPAQPFPTNNPWKNKTNQYLKIKSIRAIVWGNRSSKDKLKINMETGLHNCMHLSAYGCSDILTNSGNWK